MSLSATSPGFLSTPRRVTPLLTRADCSATTFREENFTNIQTEASPALFCSSVYTWPLQPHCACLGQLAQHGLQWENAQPRFWATPCSLYKTLIKDPQLCGSTDTQHCACEQTDLNHTATFCRHTRLCSCVSVGPCSSVSLSVPPSLQQPVLAD